MHAVVDSHHYTLFIIQVGDLNLRSEFQPITGSCEFLIVETFPAACLSTIEFKMIITGRAGPGTGVFLCCEGSLTEHEKKKKFIHSFYGLNV